MDAQQIPAMVLKELGIRIGPAMAQYVARQLAGDGTPPTAPISVIGGDARTGVPMRKTLEPAAFLPSSSAR